MLRSAVARVARRAAAVAAPLALRASPLAPRAVRRRRAAVRARIVLYPLTRALQVAPLGLGFASPCGVSAAGAASRLLRTAAYAGEAESPAARAPDRDAASQLFVGNLSFTVDEAQLASLFAAYDLKGTKVVYDQATGRSKGIAFVTFGSPADAEKARAEVNGQVCGWGQSGLPDLARQPPALNPAPPRSWPAARSAWRRARRPASASRTSPGRRTSGPLPGSDARRCGPRPPPRAVRRVSASPRVMC